MPFAIQAGTPTILFPEMGESEDLVAGMFDDG